MNSSIISEGQKSRHNLILCSRPHWTEMKVLARAVLLIWTQGPLPSSLVISGMHFLVVVGLWSLFSC